MHFKILLFVRALRRFCEKSVRNFSSYNNIDLIVETATEGKSRLQRRLQTRGLVNALIPTFASQAVETCRASPEKGARRTTARTSSVIPSRLRFSKPKPFLPVQRGGRCRGRPLRRPSSALSLPGARRSPAAPRTDRSGPRLITAAPGTPAGGARAGDSPAAPRGTFGIVP